MSPSFTPPTSPGWGNSIRCCWNAPPGCEVDLDDYDAAKPLPHAHFFGPQLIQVHQSPRCLSIPKYDDFDGIDAYESAAAIAAPFSSFAPAPSLDQIDQKQEITEYSYDCALSSRYSSNSPGRRVSRISGISRKMPPEKISVAESVSSCSTFGLGSPVNMAGTLRRTERTIKQSVSTSGSHHTATYLVDKLILSGLTESSMIRIWPEKNAAMLNESRKDNKRKAVRHGARLLIVSLCIVIFYRIYANLLISSDCATVFHRLGYRLLITLLEIAFAILLVAVLCWCRMKVRTEHRTEKMDKVCQNVYYGCICIIGIYALLMFVPPLGLACDDLIKIALCRRSDSFFTHISEVGCGLQGCTAMMLLLCFGTLLPHALPELRQVLVSVSLEVLLWCALTAYAESVHGQLHDWLDFACGLGLLLCSGVVSARTKQYMRNKHHKAFKLKYILKENGKNIFKILECMVPLHVVVPMVKNTGETIAQQIDIASILFLVIDGFEQYSRNREPREVLDYLNNIFSELDAICEAHEVTKIETVSEEYVAAVGVVPPDPHDYERSLDHSFLLGCIIKAALDMFRLQRDQKLDFKMGLHTGPIVAGVIGEKLPRYRLFGDTMNTAARMMQKGLVGELQFSESTKNYLPEWVSFTDRGPIEMKGKGVVQTFLLEWKNREDQFHYWTMDSQHVKRVSREEPREEQSPVMPIGGDYKEKGTTVTKYFGRRSTLSSFSESEEKHSTPVLTQSMSENTKFAMVVKALDVEMQRSRTSFFSQPTSSSAVTGSISFFQQRSSQKFLGSQSGGSSMTAGGRFSVETIADRAQRRCCLFFGFGSKGLSDDELVQFYTTFCKSRLINKDYRVEIQILLLLVVSGIEYFVAALYLDILHEFHESFNTRRYTKFWICRGVAFITMSTWWLVTFCFGKLSIQRIMQIRTFLACILIASFFLSYEALTPKLYSFSSKVDENEIRRALSDQIYRIRLWPLMFFGMYFLIAFDLRVPPLHTFIVVCFSLVIVSVGSRETVIDWDWNMEFGVDQVAAFLFVGLLAVERARAEVQGNKSDRKIELAVAQTGDRVRHILESLLPPLVVAELQISEPMPCHRYEKAIIAQSDLVGFTALASKRRPVEVVEIIRDLFDQFDELADTYGVYKVETVGDAYIAGQAEHTLTAEYRPANVLLFAIAIVHATQHWSRLKREHVGCRVGVHTGPCIGGIVGINMQRYHLFGRLLSIVEMLEATSLDGQVHISKACRAVVAAGVKPSSRNSAQSDSSQSFCGEAQFTYHPRECPHLTTSKGELVEFEAVDGYPTYFASLPKGECGSSQIGTTLTA